MSISDRDPESGISLVDGPVENPDIESASPPEVRQSPAKRWLSGTLSQKPCLPPSTASSQVARRSWCSFLDIRVSANPRLSLTVSGQKKK
jgi:hypothetical protein